MDKEKIQNDIDATVAQSPIKTKEEAAKSMSFPAAPEGQSTLVTGDIEGNVADQIVDTPDRGIAFDPNSTEVYTGGTALPNLNYNTRRQTAEDRGNPLYFEPNYQPVVPFNVSTPYGDVSSTTLDPEKLAWQIATSVAGRHDDEYIGYKRMPRAGSLGWGSHLLGAAKQFTYNLGPELMKGAAGATVGTAAAAFRRGNAIEKDYLADMYGMQFDDGEERKPSALAASLRARGFKPSEEDKQEHLARLEEGAFWADGYQYVQDQVNDSMNWAEAHYGNTLVADFLDKSGKAATATGVASGVVNFGAALLSRNPKAVFTLLNFAAQNDMRKNALNAGVSPAWADAYSIGGSALNSALDMFQFEAITGGFALTRKAVYEMMAKEGAYKFHLGRAIGKNALDLFVVEPSTEMVQESIEGAYDPEFLEDPTDRLAVAAISAMALKAIMLPAAVRHAKAEERLAVAQALGVDVQYLSIVKDASTTLDNWVKQGKLDASRRDEVMEMILSRAPDQIAAEIRTGVLGQLNKVSPKERQEFAEMLTNVDKNSITMKEFNALDVRVDESLKNFDVSSDMKTLIKGIVRGLAALKLTQDGTAPNQIQIPNFVITNKDASSYNAKTNTIELSTQWSNTEFTKVRDSQTSDFNPLVSSSFIPSTTQSDRMSSLIHELGHWVDYQIGEKGFGDFLEHYYNNIARVFGNEKALNVYNASKQGAKRYGASRKGDYTSENNATEYMAQTLSRLGKRSAEYFGLGKSKAARFLSYANIMFNQMSEWNNASGIKRNTDVLGSFQTAMQEVAKHNMDVIKDLVNAFGEEGIRQALRDFLNQTENPNEDFAEYLARHDMLKQLFDVMDSFADAAGTEQIGRLFDSQEQIESFVTQGDTYFNTGYDNEVEAVKQRRAEAAQKAAQKAGTAPATTTAKNNVKQVALSNGQTVSVPKNVQNFGGDKGIDAVRKLLKGNDEAIENERFWSNAKYHFEGGVKISEQSEDIQNAVKKLATKHLFDSDGLTLPETGNMNIGEPSDVLDLTGDEFVDLLNRINEMDLSLTRKQLGSYSLGYWGDYLDPDTYGLESDRIANPNDYVAGTDPVAEVQQAFEQGKSDPVDETPSYDVEVDGRKLGEDIAGLTQGIMKRAKNLPNKVVKWAASSPWGWGLDRIMITMFGRDVAEKLDVGGKYTQRNALRSGMFNRFMKNLGPIIGNIETDNRAAMFKYKTMLNQLGFVRVKDVEINNPVVPELSNKRDLTGWEVMYVYLMKRMGEKYGNRVQQSTKTDINELIATLTDEEKQFADTMSDTLRSIWADRVGEDRAVFNYFPIMDAEHSFFDETNIDNLKARMETDSPISIEDAGRLFSKEISRMSSWESGYYRTLKRIRDVLQYKGAEGRNIDPAVDDELKRASGILAGQIKDIFGIDGYHNVLRLLDQQIADPQEQMLDSAASKTLNQMGMNVIKGLLSFKFMSLPKNMTNLAMMWGGANDQSTYWNGFAEGVANMKRTWEYMMKRSKEIQIRYKDAGYNEFLDQRNTGGNTAPIFKGISRLFAKMDWGSDKTGGMAKMSAALDMMGDAGLKLFMLNGDAVANIYGGYGLIKDYMAQGLTEEEAFRKLDRYIVEHQSSSNLAMKPLRQLEANKSLAGQLFAFTSEGVAKWASVLGAFDEVQMGTATKSEAIANALSVAASMVLFAFLGAGVWDLWDDDDKVREEAVKSLEGAMIDQVFGATIMGNGFITPMIQNLAGVGGNTGISAPIWSVVSEGITNLKRGEYDRIATKAMEASGLLIGANALYNDIQGMMFMNADDPDLREAGFRMLSGRTVGYAEKRTGAKIRNRNNENVENSDEE